MGWRGSILFDSWDLLHPQTFVAAQNWPTQSVRNILYFWCLVLYYLWSGLVSAERETSPGSSLELEPAVRRSSSRVGGWWCWCAPGAWRQATAVLAWLPLADCSSLPHSPRPSGSSDCPPAGREIWGAGRLTDRHTTEEGGRGVEN